MARPRTPTRQRKNKNPDLPLGEGGPAGSPRRRKPSPTLKVAGPKALTDEGSQLTQRTGPGLNRPCPAPHPSGLRPATLSQERVLYLPLGEGGPAGPEEGRHQVRPKCRPTPVPGYARPTLSQERVPYLPLGEGGPAGPEEGRYQVRPCAAPHPSRPVSYSTLS